jgi:hypothetical protein
MRLDRRWIAEIYQARIGLIIPARFVRLCQLGAACGDEHLFAAENRDGIDLGGSSCRDDAGHRGDKPDEQRHRTKDSKTRRADAEGQGTKRRRRKDRKDCPRCEPQTGQEQPLS